MEQFKEIVPKYEVSTYGNVKSFMKNRKGRLLTPRHNKNGYLCVYIWIGGKPKLYAIHRLVAQAFIPNPANKPEVNHINGIKSDNRVENLEWCTRSENRQHAYDTGLARQGEKHGRAKLTNDQARYIRENPDNLKGRVLAKKFGVSEMVISNIQRGKSYKIVGGAVRDKFGVSANIREEICHIYAQGGISKRAIAKKFGITHPTVTRIVNMSPHLNNELK